VFPQVSSDLVDRAAAGLMSRGVDLGAARRHGVMPVISGSFPPFPDVCVPETSSTSCDQAVFVDHATDMSLSPDAVLVEVDRFG
jgi:hypothetical protein